MCEKQRGVQCRRHLETVTGEVHTACITNLAAPEPLRAASVLSPIGAPSCWGAPLQLQRSKLHHQSAQPPAAHRDHLHLHRTPPPPHTTAAMSQAHALSDDQVSPPCPSGRQLPRAPELPANYVNGPLPQ
jgi:hypothetical protein